MTHSRLARAGAGMPAAKALRLAPLALLGALSASPLAAQQADTITLGRLLDADRYDPQRSSALAAAEVLYMIGDTLVTLSPDQRTVEPELAESWEVSEDGLTYTFHLKQGVTYCSGKPFTAADVLGSMDRWLTPDTPAVSTWRAGEVDSITAPDDYTVVYKLKKPSSNLLFQMASFNFIIINPDQAKELGDDFGVTGFDGTGPFCLDSWSPRDQVVLTRHEGYTWGDPSLGNPGPAKVAKIIWKIVPESSTLVATIPAGEVDASYTLPGWAIAQFANDPSVQLLRPESSYRTHYTGMKITRPALQDIRVREAITHAIDQDAIAEGLFFGNAKPAISYYAESVLDFPADTDTHFYTYDPEKSAALLTEAGYTKNADGFWEKDGEPLVLTYYGFSETLSREIAEAVQGDLRKVGIQVNVESYDSTAIWAKLREPTYDLYEMSYPYVSAGDALNLYFNSASIPSPNRMEWNDPETDQLMDAGNSAVNDADRAAAFEELTRHVHEAVLWKPLVEETPTVVANTRIAPFEPAGMSGAVFDSGLNLAIK